MEFFADKIALSAINVSLDNVLRRLILFLFFELLVVLHNKQLTFGSCIIVDNFSDLLFNVAHLLVFK